MFILIDKPNGMSSHDVVNKLRRISGERRIGHAGTLDPNATGLLIIGVGRESTKRLDQFLKLNKEYMAEIYLGEERDTDDSEGKFVVSNSKVVPNYAIEQIQLQLESFEGKQLQTPPQFSALKISGNPAYRLARKGKSVTLKPREICILKIDLMEYSSPFLKIRVQCSSGTYIRALARDIGRSLGCGAYLNNLRRNKIGNYEVSNAVPLADLSSNNWKQHLFDI